MSQDGLLYAGDGIFSPFSGSGMITITDPATWDDFLGGWYDAPTLADVDFDNEIVAVAQYAVGGTCAMSLARHGLWASNVDPTYPELLYAQWEDSTGSCNAVCSMAAQSTVIYAIPRSRGWPGACATVVNRCDQ